MLWSGTRSGLCHKKPQYPGTIQYLQMERGFEVLRLTSFVTRDLISFEKRKNNLWSNGDQIPVVSGDGQKDRGQQPEVIKEF